MPKNPQKGNSSSESSQILILQFPIPRASLPPSPSLSNPTLANWNPSSTQSSSYSSLVSLFCHTPFDHAPPLVHATTLKSPLKIRSFTSVSFYLHIPPLLVHKIILTISTNAPFLYTSAFFTSLFLCTTIPRIYTKNIFPASAI